MQYTQLIESEVHISELYNFPYVSVSQYQQVS